MSPLRRVHAIAVLALVYFITARVGLAVHAVNDVASLVWAPAGISLGALVLYGRWLWPGVAIGTLSSMTISGFSIDIAVWIACADVLEVLLGATLLRRVVPFRPALDGMPSVLFLVLTAIGISSVAATLSYAGAVVAEVAPGWTSTQLWSTWWWGHLSGYVVVSPLVFTWGAKQLRPAPRPRPIEAVVLGGALLLVDMLIIRRWFPQWLPGWHAPYYLVPLLLWTALRFGPRGAATANLVTNALLILGVSVGLEPYRDLSDLQSFIAVSSLTTLTVSALALERVRATQRKAAILAAAQDAIVTVDAEDHVLEFNPAAEELFGYREDQVLRKKLATLVVPPALADSYHRLLATLASGQVPIAPRRVRTTARRADGREFPVELSVARVPLGDELLVTGFVRDVTVEQAADKARREAHELLGIRVDERTRELVRTNLVLARREELLRDAEALAHLGSFELDLDAEELHWSDEMYRIYGRDPAAFTPTYTEFLGAVHPDDRARIESAIQRAIAERSRFSFEARIILPDGSVRLVQSQGRVIADDQGLPRRVLGCCQDVTDRVRAQDALAQLGELVQSSHDAIIGLDADGTVRTWNPAAVRIFGFEPHEMIGQACTKLLPEEDQRKLDMLLAAVREGQPLTHYELPHVRKDGGQFEASVSISAIVDRHGHVRGMSQVIRDVSEQKLTEHELRTSLAEKDVLLREIHHRVKNNLQVISSLLNLQAAGEVSEDTRRRLLESQNRIQSMALVHQLLYQSHGLATIDFSDYLHGLTNRLVSAYSLKPHRIEVRVSAPTVSLDIDRAIPCGLIVNELVTNALTHAFRDDREGHVGHIWVVLARDRGELVLSVRDDGVGMPKGVDLEAVPSFGLQIARLLAHQLGGSISLESNGGTTVEIHFPEYPAAAHVSVH